METPTESAAAAPTYFGNPRLEHHCAAVSAQAYYETHEKPDIEIEREQLHRWCVADAKASMPHMARELVRLRIDSCKRFKLEADKFVERFPALSEMSRRPSLIFFAGEL